MIYKILTIVNSGLEEHRECDRGTAHRLTVHLMLHFLVFFEKQVIQI